jgi:hypothetical protein
VLLKVDCKISVSFGRIQNFKVSNLAMAKVKKANIAVTYLKVLLTLVIRHPYQNNDGKKLICIFVIISLGLVL